MDIDQFWALIESARGSVSETKDMPSWLTSYLKVKPVDYIGEFLVQYHEVYSKAYDDRLWEAAQIMCGGMCSRDSFDDFLGWLIAQGRSVYESALNNPDALATIEQIEGDDGTPTLFYMGGVAERAYAEKIGVRQAQLPIELKRPTLLNTDNQNNRQLKLAEVYPKLWAKYRKKRNR